MQGNKLASGAKSATFPPPKVSQAKWDRIFGKITVPERNCDGARKP